MRLIDADKMTADLLTVDPQFETMIHWCLTVLDAQPTIEPERKKGEWLCSDDMYETGICNSCGWDSEESWENVKKWFNFCPNCGSFNKET